MVTITAPVPSDRAARYRAAGLWDDRELTDGIEAAAALAPGAIALVDDGESLTAAEVAARVAGATEHLRARGLRAGTSAVFVTGNRAAGVVVYHALLRTGATAILLDRRCGPADLRLAVELCGTARPTVICPTAEAERLLSDLEVDHLDLSAVATARSIANAGPGTARPDRDAAAMVLFTSGTTSRPKGVIHSLTTHTAGARNMADVTRADAGTTVYLVSPLTSITGVMQMHLCADRHATLVLDDAFEADRALGKMRELDVDLLGGAPVIVERLLAAATARGDQRIGLRRAALGGAMLPLPLLRRATDEFGIEIVRVYGSSEAPNATGSLPGDDLSTRLADDGALMAGTEVRVGSLEDAREGLLRGPALFLGYVDPADNERAFEDGWFRTGDAVEVHDGRLTVVGRLNDVVNRNGLKISLAEVDHLLARLPDAVECASFALADPETGERLVVAVRPLGGATVTLAAVVDHLRSGGIATRKLPEQLVLWDEPLPRTATGKIVRPRLARESAGRPGESSPRVRQR